MHCNQLANAWAQPGDYTGLVRKLCWLTKHCKLKPDYDNAWCEALHYRKFRFAEEALSDKAHKCR